ncbi:MAG: hypothetical protein V1495_08730 [Pseudomonadota bacterium]
MGAGGFYVAVFTKQILGPELAYSSDVRMRGKDGRAMTKLKNAFAIISILGLFGCAGMKEAADDLNNLAKAGTETGGTTGDGLNTDGSLGPTEKISPETRAPGNALPLVVTGTEIGDGNPEPDFCVFENNATPTASLDEHGEVWITIAGNVDWLAQIEKFDYKLKHFGDPTPMRGCADYTSNPDGKHCDHLFKTTSDGYTRASRDLVMAPDPITVPDPITIQSLKFKVRFPTFNGDVLTIDKVFAEGTACFEAIFRTPPGKDS